MIEPTLEQRISQSFSDRIVEVIRRYPFSKLSNRPNVKLTSVISIPRIKFLNFDINLDLKMSDIDKLVLEDDNPSVYSQARIAQLYTKDIRQAAILIGSGFISDKDAIEILETKFDHKCQITAIDARYFEDKEISELDILIAQYCELFEDIPETVIPRLKRFAKVAGHAFIKAQNEVGLNNHIDYETPVLELMLNAHPETALRDAISSENLRYIILIVDSIEQYRLLSKDEIVDCFPDAISATSVFLKSNETAHLRQHEELLEIASTRAKDKILMMATQGYAIDFAQIKKVLDIYNSDSGSSGFMAELIGMNQEEFEAALRARIPSILDAMKLFGETEMDTETLIKFISGPESKERDFAIDQAVTRYKHVDPQVQDVLKQALQASGSLDRIDTGVNFPAI